MGTKCSKNMSVFRGNGNDVFEDAAIRIEIALAKVKLESGDTIDKILADIKRRHETARDGQVDRIIAAVSLKVGAEARV